MGLFDSLTGTKKPDANVSVRSVDDLRTELLGLNRDTAPYVVRAAGDEKADLVAEWCIVDATWYAIFAKAGLSKVAKILMRFDTDKTEVRSADEEYTVEWNAGVPTLSVAAQKFRGQQTSVQFGRSWAFTEQGQYGEVYNYHFDTKELKKPLQDATTSSGWTWRGVAFGKL